MRSRLILIFIICFSISAFAQNRSSIDFVIKNLGINVDGYFNTFSIDSEFNSSNQLQSLSGKIEVSSIRTGIESRDEHLLEEDYFNVEAYEYITFKSILITQKSINKYEAKINLTIKESTRAITISVTVEKQSDNLKLSSDFEINRKDFDVGGRSFIMSKTVKISVVNFQNY